jgi:hypothetical protein
MECSDILARKNNPRNEIALLFSLKSISRYYYQTIKITIANKNNA